jgi:hypothetical protein
MSDIKPSVNDLSIGDQLLVEKLASGNADIGDLGKVVAKTYQQTDHQTQVLEDHSIKLIELTDRVNILTPKVDSLIKTQARGRWVGRTLLGILTFLGFGVITEAINGGQRLAWVLSLSEPKVAEIASKEAQKETQKVSASVAELSHKVEITELEFNLKRK